MARCHPGAACPCRLCLGILARVSCWWFLQGNWPAGYFAATLHTDAGYYHPFPAHWREIRDYWSCHWPSDCHFDPPHHQPVAGNPLCACLDPGYFWGITVIFPGSPGDGSHYFVGFLSYCELAPVFSVGIDHSDRRSQLFRDDVVA